MGVRLGTILWRASIFVAAGWLWFNYSTGWATYSVTAASAQAGIIALIGLALRSLTGGKKA